jgi:L-rhamnose-H+ transport protein
MQPNPLLGVVYHWLGGLASGTFYVPYKGVRKWSWETFWLAGGMFSWLICPWVGALRLTKDLLAVLHETSSYTFWMTYLMGALWGLGGLTFGLTMRYLGMSLGMAVALGYCAAFGTLVPPLVKGEFAAKLLQTHGGNICFLGVIVCLVGIAIGGIAGVRKERDMGNDGKSSAIKEFSLWKGLAIATFSGVMSSCFSYGFQFGDPITKISASHGTGPYWVGSAGHPGDFARRPDHEFHLVRAVEHQEPHRLSISSPRTSARNTRITAAPAAANMVRRNRRPGPASLWT